MVEERIRFITRNVIGRSPSTESLSVVAVPAEPPPPPDGSGTPLPLGAPAASKSSHFNYFELERESELPMEMRIALASVDGHFEDLAGRYGFGADSVRCQKVCCTCGRDASLSARPRP